MKFKKLILKDFFRYYGTQEIDCTVDDDKTVVVVIGENGRGKTTILSAFNFALYGKLLEPLLEDNMLNYRSRNELPCNSRCTESFVEVLFEEAGIDYSLKRIVEFKKDTNGNIIKLTNKAKVILYRIGDNGNKDELNFKAFEDRFLIPENLSGFFFFDGERINRLAKVDGKDQIRKAILNILGISHIDNARTDIGKVKKTLIEQSKNYSSGADYNDLVDQIEEITEKIDKINIEDKKNEENIKLAEKKFREITEKIRNSDSKNVKEWEKQRDSCNRFLNDYNGRLNNIEKKIKKHIGENFKYYLAKDVINDTSKILEEKKTDGILPSNIKETFIDDLLKNKKCICGTCLEKGSKEFEAVVSIKDRAGSKELDNAYYELKELISKVKIISQNFYPKLDEMLKDRKKIKQNIYDTNAELVSISNKLKNSDIEAIRNAEIARDELRNEISNLNQKKGKLEIRKNDYSKKKESLEKTLRTLDSNNKQIKELQRKLNIISKIENLNEDFKVMFTEIVREELDTRIKDVFSKITNKSYRVPVLTKDFELKITSTYTQINVEESFKKDEVLSTGEGQITSLSFIGALVSYARDKRDDKILSKLSGDEYPIVMDSPFGNLDEIHTENVASNIGKLSSQVIIVVSKKQWEGHVEQNILGQVKRKYRMVDGDITVDGGECTFIESEMV